MRTYLVGVRSALHGAGLPYGFTVTVFCSGQGLVHFHGPPDVGLLLLFAAGSTTGYGLLRLVVRQAAVPVGRQFGATSHSMRAGIVHVTAIGLAIGSAMLAGMALPSLVAWPLGGCLATSVYLATVAVEMALMENEPA